MGLSGRESQEDWSAPGESELADGDQHYMNQTWIKILPAFIRIRLEKQQNLRKIITNTGWLSADQVLRLGVGLFIGAWVARYLGPERFGLYAYVAAFVSLFVPFATMGLDNIVVRELVRDPQCKEEVLGTTFILKLIGGTITLLGVLGVISQLRPDEILTQLMVGILATQTVFQAFNTIDFWFQSQVQARYVVWANVSAFAIATVAKIILILVQAPLIAFVWVAVPEAALSAIGLLIAYHKTGNHVRFWRTSLTRAKTLLRDSWPLMLSGFAIMIYMRIDQIMLGQMVGNDAVGIYAAATRISEVWHFVPMAIASSVFPAIIEARKFSEKLYYERLQKLLNLMALLSYAVAISITLLSKWIVIGLFGSEYAQAGSVLAIRIWAGVFVASGVIGGKWLVAENLVKFSLTATVIGAVTNVVLNYFLLPNYGVIGASTATVVSYFVAAYGVSGVYPRTRRFFVAQTKAFMLLGLMKR